MKIISLSFIFFIASAWTYPRQRVSVYSGPGASHDLVLATIDTLQRILSMDAYEIQEVGAQYLANPAWIPKTSLLVFPGGQTSPYVKDLAGDGVENIKKYVNSGGNYLGFCAGAYFAADLVEFMPRTVNQIISKRPLGFYPDTMAGPTFSGFDYRSDNGARAADITFSFPNENKSIRSLVYYNGGGSFLNVHLHKNVEILAKYNEAAVESNQVAAVLCKVGKGKAILTGAHPEFIPKKSSNRFYYKLNPYKSDIDKVFTKWFLIFGLKVKSTSGQVSYFNPKPKTISNAFTSTHRSNNYLLPKHGFNTPKRYSSSPNFASTVYPYNGKHTPLNGRYGSMPNLAQPFFPQTNKRSTYRNYQ